MLEEILPEIIVDALKKIDYKWLQELRIRAEKPMTVCYDSEFYYLGQSGLISSGKNAISLGQKSIQNIVSKSANFSIYAVNEDIKNGFITLNNGIRIGITGQVVMEENKMQTIKNFSSLTIRFPHQIIGCSENIIEYLFQKNEFLNTLIISPPSSGKTTLLRDLVRSLASEKALNVLLVDERNEISATTKGVNQLNIGEFCDTIINGNKYESIINGIRSMNPQVIATDEIGTKKDFEALKYASTCGVKLLCTIHGKNLNELKRKKEFEQFLTDKTFDRYIVLQGNAKKGQIEGIYDENFELLELKKWKLFWYCFFVCLLFFCLTSFLFITNQGNIFFKTYMTFADICKVKLVFWKQI